MAKRRPNPDVVELLEALLAQARAGEVTAIFAVIRLDPDLYSHEWATDDLDDLICQVRTEIIIAQADAARGDPVH